MKQLIHKDYSEYDFLADYQLSDKRILNAGSSSLRYGANCVNVDIQTKPNVDVVCDIHSLPESLGLFDAVICNATLQYCHSPNQVAGEFYRVLKPGGYLFIDSPWIQPFYSDTPDKFRFSQDALKIIFSDFEIVKVDSSIRSGSAFAMLGVRITQNLTSNKYINYGLSKIVMIILSPFKWIKTTNESSTAGAFYIVCRKNIK